MLKIDYWCNLITEILIYGPFSLSLLHCVLQIISFSWVHREILEEISLLYLHSNAVSLNSDCDWVCACGLGGLCLQGEAEQEKLERAAATQNMDRAFTWPCALWVRQVAASSTGPPTWASCCCYRCCRHRSVCCRWEACRYIHTHTHIHHFLHLDEHTPELQLKVDTSTELQEP